MNPRFLNPSLKEKISRKHNILHQSFKNVHFNQINHHKNLNHPNVDPKVTDLELVNNLIKN